MSAVGELCPSVVIREDNNSMLNHTVELCCFIPRQIILGIVSKLYVKNYLDLSTKNLSFYLEIRSELFMTTNLPALIRNLPH